jgi:hypothetical protein
VPLSLCIQPRLGQLANRQCCADLLPARENGLRLLDYIVWVSPFCHDDFLRGAKQVCGFLQWNLSISMELNQISVNKLLTGVFS